MLLVGRSKTQGHNVSDGNMLQNAAFHIGIFVSV